jgi:hypothetical protein
MLQVLLLVVYKSFTHSGQPVAVFMPMPPSPYQVNLREEVKRLERKILVKTTTKRL